MSHANVYRFFPSKAGLIEAVVVAWLRSVEVTLSDISSGSDPADDKLERFLIAWARAQRDGLDRDAPIYSAYATFAAERRDAVMAHRARVRTLLTGIVEDGMEPGPFRVRNLERAVSLVADAMQRFVHPTLVGETRDVSRSQVEARAGAVIRVVVRTLVNGSV
jgi:AcrR family transcriptional regulator